MYGVVPELQYWFKNYIVKSNLNKSIIPYPSATSLDILNRTSFIEMLLNESYSEDNYRYLYLRSYNIPSMIRTRMSIYQGTQYYMIDYTDSTEGINIFNITEDDILILNKLLEYRLDPDNTTLDNIPFDSSAFNISQADTTTFINYDEMNADLTAIDSTAHSILYNLIYIYLDLKINNSTNLYDNLALLSLDNTSSSAKSILECMYESFLIENMFDLITQSSVTFT